MTQVFGRARAREFRAIAAASLSARIAEAPSDHGFQVLQYLNIRQRQRRFINSAQVAKLGYVDIYHPIADGEFVTAALQLPSRQLMPVSVLVVVLKKLAQLTLGQWLRRTRLGEFPLIRARRYYVDYPRWSRGPLRGFIEANLLSPELEALNLFDIDGLRELVTDHMEGRLDATGFLGEALAVSMWARLFFRRSSPAWPPNLEHGDSE
jgi:hypothetical protein